VLTELPAHLGAVSFVPGPALDYVLNERWHIEPYARAGGSFASGQFDGGLYATGASNIYTWRIHEVATRMVNDVLYAGVIYKDRTSANDNLVRLRNGIELCRQTGLCLGPHRIELGVYGYADYFPDAPRPPIVGTGASRLQLEPGLLIGAERQWRIHGWELPASALAIASQEICRAGIWSSAPRSDTVAAGIRLAGTF
jgi:hypothetical protein